MTTPRDTDQEHIAAVAGRLDAVDLGRRMGDHLLEAIPALGEATDEDFRDILVRSCTSNVVEILEALVNGSPVDEASPPPDATTWAHELVHRGMPLATLLRTYRLGHWVFEQSFEAETESLDLDAGTRLRVLARASSYCFGYIDLVCEQLVGEYESERDEWLRGAAAVQAELVREVLAGAEVDEEAASATLGYDVWAPQRGFVVWREPTPGAVPGVPPVTVARRVAACLGGAPPLVVPVGDHVAWGWVSGVGIGDAVPPDLSDPDGARLALGGVHPGLAGMRRSHREALAARRVVEVFGLPADRPHVYADVALRAVATADPAAAVELVETEIGPLLEEGDPAARLRETVAVYLAESLSPSRTARRLGVHQNTVIHRVKRAEELLGRPLTERRLELEVAIRLHEGLDGLRSTD